MYPPSCGSGEEWAIIDKINKLKYPKRYWLNEVLIPNVWWPIPRFFKNIRDQIRWRFFEKFHIIDTKLKPEYYDCDHRMLHGMFALLVDFVEIEKAWMQAVFSESYKKPWYPFARFRDRERGIKYLEWEMTLTEKDESPEQAKNAKIIKELYLWWVDVRPVRLDPYELMTEDIFPPDRNLFDRIGKTTDEQHKIFERINELEKENDDEDTEMLVKLIKLRGSLWT